MHNHNSQQTYIEPRTVRATISLPVRMALPVYVRLGEAQRERYNGVPAILTLLRKRRSN